jgi:hypothetical protein
MDRVLTLERIPNVRIIPGASAPPAFAGSSLTLPALPAETYRLSSDKQRIREVQDVIRKSRENALTEISTQLRDTYLKDVQRSEQEEIAKLGPQEQAAFQHAMEGANAVFEEYARKRGPLLAKLSLFAGFPDVDPASQKQPPRSNRAVFNEFQEAKTLRAQLAELDRSYQQQASSLFGQARSEYAAGVQRVTLQFQRMRATADERARREAQAEVSKEQAQLTSALGDKTVSFPAQRGRTVTVEGSKPPAAPPAVDVPGRQDMLQRLKGAEQSDLKIWAGLKGYVISSERGGARDATAEFVKWRQSHLALR